MSKYRNVISLFSATVILLAAHTAWAAPCGNVGYQGCCTGTTAYYCSSGVLKSKSCIGSSYGSKCGWVTSQNFYSCSTTEAKDPSGKYERDCSKLPPKADAGAIKYDAGTTKKDYGASVPCGKVTHVGCCTGAKTSYCSGGKLITKDCTNNSSGPACGWVTSKNYYSCNKTATTDPSGKNVRDCSKLPAKADAGATKKDGSVTTACGQVTSKGCCNGETVKYCASGKLVTKDCTKNSSGTKCGWDTKYKSYSCGSSGLSDPNGTYPKACGAAKLDSGGITKQDTGSVINKDTGGVVKKDTGAINPPKKDDSGSCSVSGSGANPSGLLLTLALLALALRRRRS